MLGSIDSYSSPEIHETIELQEHKMRMKRIA